MIKVRYKRRDHLLRLDGVPVGRFKVGEDPMAAAIGGASFNIALNDDDAIRIRDAITAEHPFEPTDKPASADPRDAEEMRELLSELEESRDKAIHLDLMAHRHDMSDVQFNLGRVAAFSTAISDCRSRLMLMDQQDDTEGES